MPLRAERLKTIRQRKNYNQTELAEALGTSQQQIARWENGSNDPTADVVARLATVLDCTTDWLLGLVDEPNEYMQPQKLSEDELQLIELYRQRKLPQIIMRLVSELSATDAEKNLVVDGVDEPTVPGEDVALGS